MISEKSKDWMRGYREGLECAQKTLSPFGADIKEVLGAMIKSVESIESRIK